MKAVWKDQILAESQETIVVEGNHYFPEDSIRKEFFLDSPTETTCPWKGHASYFHIKIDDQTNKDAAWTYLNPSEAALRIKGYVAFWKGVEIRT